MSHRVVLPPDLVHGPFDAAMAEAAGLSERQLRSATVRPLRWGVYASASLPDSLDLQCAAAALILPRCAAFSHHTAAELYGLPGPRSAKLHVLVPADVTVPNAAGIAGHCGLLVGETRTYAGHQVVTPQRLFVDMAAHLALTDLIVLGDAMLNRGVVGVHDLHAHVSGIAGKRGICKARSAVPQLNPTSASPMETRTRVLLVSAGLPRPRANEDISDDAGGWLARGDLVYRTFKVLIEYQGDQHRTDRAQWQHDIFRAELLREHGWTVIHLTADDVMQRPERTVQRVRRALVDRGYRDGPATS